MSNSNDAAKAEQRTLWRARWRNGLLAGGIAAVLAVATGATSAGCSEGDDDTLAGVDCESTKQYFAEHAWRILETKCMSCHNPQGVARDTGYVLKGSAEAGFLDHNLEVIRDRALFEKEGKSLFLLKPSLQMDHYGGEVVPVGSPDYKVLNGLVARLKANIECEQNAQSYFTGVEILSAEATLRKAALLLAARLPSLDELEEVRLGGDAALAAVVDRYLTEEAFYETLRRTFNDLFTTDFYLTNGVDQLDDEDGYADPYWFERADRSLLTQYNLRSSDELRRFTNVGIAREPLELVVHVVKNDLPFTEIVTANYMMVTPFSARSYGITDVEFESDNDPFEYQPAQLTDFPHAGVLTSPMMLGRHPSTPTNRNRHRARVIYDWFLGTDILRTAERPVDQTAVTAINPTRDDSACSVCHGVMDPIAGTFAAFNDAGRYNPEPEWYQEMFQPGFGKHVLPLNQLPEGVQWLGANIAQDHRFALASVYNMYRGLTGQEPLVPPTDYEDPAYQAKFQSFLAQSNTFEAVAAKFEASGYNLRVVVRELVLSPYFRAKNSVALAPDMQARLSEVGMGHLLTPEQLHDKIRAVLGIPWLDPDNDNTAPRNGNGPRLAVAPRNPADLGTYQLFYGGVDSNETITRISEPNGVMAAVAERMANEMACYSVANDFSLDPGARLLFPTVQLEGTEQDPLLLEPETPSGLPIPSAAEGIKLTIQHLHAHVLGEQLTLDDEEIERTFKLFTETWRDGNEKMKLDPQDNPDNTVGESLPQLCSATRDFWSGTPYPEDRQITTDETYVIRSWMAVMTYLLSDYRFLYE